MTTVPDFLSWRRNKRLGKTIQPLVIGNHFLLEYARFVGLLSTCSMGMTSMPVLGFGVSTPITRREEICFDKGGSPPLGFSKSRSHQMAIVPFALSVMPLAARQVLRGTSRTNFWEFKTDAPHQSLQQCSRQQLHFCARNRAMAFRFLKTTLLIFKI
jgi:hypothetical protein